MLDRLRRLAKSLSRRGGIFMFLRAQLSAQLATVMDFLVTIVLVSWLDVYYVYATLMGAVYGGVVNCVVNYKWTFKSHGKKSHVAIKFILVWLGSVWLNTWGTYVLTEWLSTFPWVRDTLSRYFYDFFLLSKVVVSIAVAICWNYTLQRYFVYRSVHICSLWNKRNKEKTE